VTISSQVQVALLTDYDTNSAYSMAYQRLYASIRLNWDSEQVHQQTVLLATPTAYHGQATAAANIAIASAQSGTPTILVDANLRTPSLQQRFGTGEHAGLSDLLQTEHISSQHFDACLSPTFVPELRLLGAGKARLSLQEINLLFATRLRNVVEGLRHYLAEAESRPGMIIFHSAPILTDIEATSLSTLVEQTFLLIVAGQTTRAQARRAQEQLQRVHARLVGAILLDT
jgi:Mrp family chromosome partitioning ATPase